MSEATLRAEVARLRTIFDQLAKIVGYVEGINDERDSVPLLLEVRRIIASAGESPLFINPPSAD